MVQVNKIGIRRQELPFHDRPVKCRFPQIIDLEIRMDIVDPAAGRYSRIGRRISMIGIGRQHGYVENIFHGKREVDTGLNRAAGFIAGRKPIDKD